jgi:hypothetical protein
VRRNQVKHNNKIFSDREEQNTTPESSCDCCDELTVPLSQITTKTQAGKEDEEDEDEHPKAKKFPSNKTLVLIGLILTAAIVTVEVLLPHSIIAGFILLILATPVQVLLGKPSTLGFTDR